MTLLEQVVDIRQFDFRYTNGVGASGNLSASGGGKVISFTRLPFGLVSGNYVRISGGSGTAEAVAMTAVSGTGGGIGSITVTTANVHTGSWIVGSATAGIQEAACGSPDYSTILVPPNSTGYLLYAKTTIDRGHTLIGSAKYSPLRLQYTNADGIEFKNGSGILGYVGIKDIMIYSDVAAGTSGSMLAITDKVQGYVDNVELPFNAWDGVVLLNVVSAGQVYFSNIRIGQAKNIGWKDASCGGTHNNINVTVANTALHAIYLSASSVLPLAGMLWSNVATFGGVNGITFDIGVGVTTVGETFWSNVIVDNAQTNGIYFVPSATGTGYTHYFSNLYVASVLNGIIVGRGFVRMSVSDAHILCGNVGIQVAGAKSTTLQNIEITGLSGLAFVHGIQITDSVGDGTGTPTGDVRMSNVSAGFGANGDTAAGGMAQIGLYIRGTAAHSNIIADESCRFHGTSYVYYSDSTAAANVSVGQADGIKTVIPTIASATSISLVLVPNPTIKISGTNTITTLSNPGFIGRRQRLIKTDAGSATVGGGGNIPATHTLAQNGIVDLTWEGTNWY